MRNHGCCIVVSCGVLNSAVLKGVSLILVSKTVFSGVSRVSGWKHSLQSGGLSLTSDSCHLPVKWPWVTSLGLCPHLQNCPNVNLPHIAVVRTEWANVIKMLGTVSGIY